MIVKVYSTPTCPFCVHAKEFLKKNNIEYEDIDISKDQEAGMKIMEETGQTGVPIIQVDDDFVFGFNEDKLKELLKIKEER